MNNLPKIWRLYCNLKRLEGARWGGVRPLEYFGEGARPLVYFLEGAWFFSSLHDIGARPLPKIPEGARPLPKILEGAWCFSVRRAWTWRWPRQCPWSPLSPLVNWHQAELTTGREGREGEVSGHNSHLQSKLDWERPSPVWLAVIMFFFNMK